MNYYRRHLGDYAKDAGHLSLLEHGVYTLLLDRYYSTESPLSEAEAVKVCRARTREEQAAVAYVLESFFSATHEGFRSKRADIEIASYQEKSERNREIGKKGGRPRNSGNPEETQTVSKNNPSHKPIANSQEEARDMTPAGSSPASADCPHADIVELYHEILPSLARVKVWSEKRKSYLRKCWREDSKRQSLDYWRRFFTHVSQSAFLMGNAPSRDGRAWAADLEWLVTPGNFVKVIEGKYHGK